MLKKLLVGVSVLTLLLAGCMSHEYADKIAKNDSGDEVKHFDKKDANIYVFDKGKYVVLEYKPLSDDAEARYYTYEFKDKKAYYNKDFNAKAYYQSHEPDYKEENMY